MSRRIYALFIAVLITSAAFGQSQLTFPVVDSINWRDGRTDVSSATETYWYDEASDTVTVNVVFDKTSALAPLPPMLALAIEYGFDVTFNKTVVDAGSHSILGPLKGVANTDSYTWQVKGLARYALGKRNYGSGQVPDWLQQQLQTEVAEVLAAGHLSPWVFAKNTPGSEGTTRGTLYWNHPGENLYMLAELAELLPPAMQESLKAYTQSERSAYPPETMYSMSLTQGTRRAYFSMPDSDISSYAATYFAWRCQGSPRIWNLYGLARYYDFVEETPTQTVMNNCTAVVNNNLVNRDWASLYWTEGHSPHYNAVHGVNQTFAGLIGYIRIARAAGDADAETLGWGLLARMAALRFAMGKYTQFQYDYGYFTIPADPEWWAKQIAGWWQGRLTAFNWTQPIDNVRQIHWLSDQKVATWEDCGCGRNTNGQKSAGDDPWFPADRYDVRVGVSAYYLPFADMVPELGVFLKDHLAAEAGAYCDRVAENQPHWECAYAEALLGGEVGFHMPQDPYGLFSAHAWVSGDEPQELERRLDVPWLKTGDWFYLHKLAETIKAYRGVSWTGGGPAFFAAVGTSFNNDPAAAVAEAYAQAFAKVGPFRTPRFALVEENYGDSWLKPLVISEANGLPVYGASMGSNEYSVQSYDDGFIRQKGITVALIGGAFDMQVESIAMGPVDYGDPQTMIDNRQVPAAELGARFSFKPDPNVGELLFVIGSLHNPEITYFATGLAQSIPADVPVIGGAHYVPGSSGAIYKGSTTATSSALAIRLTGDFQVTQSMAGPYWQAETNPGYPPEMITQVATDIFNDMNTPDLAIAYLCASLRPWSDPTLGQQYMNDQHQALVNVLPAASEYFGTYSGGEIGKFHNSTTLTAGGAYVSILAIKSNVGASNQAPIVDAGEPQMVPCPPGTTALNGTVLDDGLPDGTLITKWTKESGPGAVTFADANDLDTAVTFSEVGQYILRLSADDGEIIEYDYVTMTVHLPDTEAPSVPQNVTAAGISGKEIAVSWDVSTDNIAVIGYSVYRNGALLRNIDSNSFTDAGLEVNTVYAYAVEAFDFAGNISAKSAPAYGKTLNDVLDGLVAQWLFDDGSGTAVADSSGNNHHGLISGTPTWTAGRYGGGLDLANADSVVVSSLQNLNLGTAFSFTLWVYPKELALRWQQPIRHGSNNWVQIGYGNCYFKSGGVEYGIGGVTANAWNHIACVRFADGSAKTYINGTLRKTGANNPYNGVGNSFTVGGGTYAGIMDDTRVYNRSLSETEINMIMNPAAYQTAIGDLVKDNQINLKDFADLANQWLWTGTPGAIVEDIIEDGSVDAHDLAVIADQWLQ